MVGAFLSEQFSYNIRSTEGPANPRMSSRRFAISCLEPEIVCELSRAISAQKNCQPHQSDDGAQMSLIDHGTLCELYNEV
jgi:hypothetical protein